MRHKKKINHLSRQRGHRSAMLANMASSLILHKRIKTTTAKAKALKIYVEPLITKAKEDTTHSRRQVFSYLQDKEATAELFRDVAVKVGDRPGGYTRIIKIGSRIGDNADMCIIELVDYNENLLAEKAAASKSSRRRRGGKKKAEGDAGKTLAAATGDQAEGAVEESVSGAEAVAENAEVEEAVVVEEEEKTELPEAEASAAEEAEEEDNQSGEEEEKKES